MIEVIQNSIIQFIDQVMDQFDHMTDIPCREPPNSVWPHATYN